MYDNAAYTQGSTFAVKQLLANGNYTTRKVTLLSGQNQVAGAVLGKITSGGKYKLSLSAASDGSEVPDMILAHDCDASGGDKECIVIETGNVVGTALTLGASHTIASIREGLRVKGILIDD
jgi:hypothetical protein